MIIKIKSGFIYVFGSILLVIGAIGLFLPILQGMLFIALGLYVLSLRSERARRLLERVLNKFPFIEKIKIEIITKAKKFSEKMMIF